MEKTIRLTDVFITLKKRWKLILLVTLVAVSIGSCLTYFVISPVYQGSTQILVNQKGTQNQLDTSQVQSNVDLINTYSVIIKSPAILDKVISQLGLPQSAEQLNKKILVTSQENSQVFSLTVEDEDAAMAVEIANTVSETFQKEIQNIMNIDNVSILAAANLKENPIPVKPIPFFNITISLVIGLIAGFGLAILLEFMDSTLKDDQDIADCLGIPVLGSIPKMSKNDNKGKKDSINQKVGSDTVAS